MHRFRHHSRDRDFSWPRGGPFGRYGRRLHAPRGRVFEQGDLRYVLLHLIGEKPSHGYELIRDIEEKVGGAYSPSPGVVYPTLTLLEELGYVAAAPSEGAKKAYAITDEGRAALKENRATVDAILARMEGLAQRLGGGPAPQIVRAMENLSTALRLRLGAGRLEPDAVARIVQALDAAVAAIERD